MLPTTILASAACLVTFGAPRPFARRHRPVLLRAIKPRQRVAEQQREVFFELAPWEKNPTLIENQRLDLRPFVFAFTDKSVASIAAVFAFQEGVPPVGKRSPWRNVGLVAAKDEASLPQAVERQRDLIEAWACEFVRDFRTDGKLMTRRKPIKLAYGFKPNGFRKAIEPTYQGELVEVPKSTSLDESVPCGFLGTTSRSKKGEKGGFRFVEVRLPD